MPWTIAYLPTQTTLDVGPTGCQSTSLGLGGRAPPDQRQPRDRQPYCERCRFQPGKWSQE
jgi:hypothetical protein